MFHCLKNWILALFHKTTVYSYWISNLRYRTHFQATCSSKMKNKLIYFSWIPKNLLRCKTYLKIQIKDRIWKILKKKVCLDLRILRIFKHKTKYFIRTKDFKKCYYLAFSHVSQNKITKKCLIIRKKREIALRAKMMQILIKDIKKILMMKRCFSVVSFAAESLQKYNKLEVIIRRLTQDWAIHTDKGKRSGIKDRNWERFIKSQKKF